MTNIEAIIEATKRDPRFERGLTLLKDARFQEAVSVFEDFLKSSVENQAGSDDLASAPIYYEYGSSILSLAETTASVFGKSLKKSEEQSPIVTEDISNDAEENISEQNTETEPEQEDPDSSTDDMEAAWEMLEVARVIYSRYTQDLGARKELARVYMRLGDHSMESENFSQAKHDYEKSLALNQEILKLTENPDTTPLADLYCCLAISCIYQDPTMKAAAESTETAETDTVTAADEGTDTTEGRKALEEEGLKYYVLAGHVMAENIHRIAASCSSKLSAFVKDRIPKYSSSIESTPAISSGKSKRNKRQDQTSKLYFLKHSMADIRQDFFALCVESENEKAELKDTVAEGPASLQAEQVAHTKSPDLSPDELRLLEFLEIYVELKEKVDGIREGLGWDESVSLMPILQKDTAGCTTIGFTDTFPASTSVNVISVVKKRKIEEPATNVLDAVQETKDTCKSD